MDDTSPATERFVRSAHGARSERAQRVAKWLFGAMALAMVAPLVGIIVYLLYRAHPSLGWEFLVDLPRKGMREGGIWPAFVGTLYLVTISLAISAPVGVLAAIYLNEYARDNWFNRLINLAVINLAGVPSIVHALFGLGAFVYAAHLGFSILAASLTLAIMTLPVIIASTREALASVPKAFREACWNVGATRWQTIRAVVLPNSIAGILTGIILQVSRAAGETAPIMFTGAVFYKAVQRGDLFPYRLGDQCMALSMHLYTVSTQVPNVEESIPYATAVVLLGSVLLVNATAIAARVFAAGGEVVTDGRQQADRRGRGLRLAYGTRRSVTASRSRSTGTRSSPSSGRPSPARPRCCAASNHRLHPRCHGLRRRPGGR
jgi:phosphate transport system permease protein